MNEYSAVYEQKFVKNLKHYSGMRQQIKNKIERLLKNPYQNTELLADAQGHLDLRGCRSVRVDRNFRIICEECLNINECQYCFCEKQTDKTIVFLTVGIHDKAYAMK